MSDSPDQIIHKQQQEIKKLKENLRREIRENRRKDKELGKKDKELGKKDKELGLERSLWSNREAGWAPSASTDLHRIEVFDGVISDESSLHSATLCSREEFQYILERAEAYATSSGDMPLLRDDESRASDPGNRCKLRIRHALLMSLMRKKDNPTQGMLQAIFGIDQTSVCRYLRVMDRILAVVLPTARKISEEMAACESKGEFKKIIPGPDGGEMCADGTHCPVQRPATKSLRRMSYSGKKKKFTCNTNVYANSEGTIIGMSKSLVGSTGDITLLREDPMPFGKWAESMRDDSTPKEDRIRVWVDRGYQEMDKDLPGVNLMIPHKRSKNHRILTAEQKEHNHLVNSTRVLVEHSIGRLKRYARLTDSYDGTISQFNQEFNVITGLVNLHLLWDRIDKGPPSPEKPGTSVDWDRPVSPASKTQS